MTLEEINSLIQFGKELDRRVTESRLSQAELSRRTGWGGSEPISQGYISDILRVGRGDSQKYFRLQRDKVIRLAEAVDWPTDNALSTAGFAPGLSERPAPDRSEITRLPEELAELNRIFLSLSPAQRKDILTMVRALYTASSGVAIVDDDELTASDAREIKKGEG